MVDIIFDIDTYSIPSSKDLTVKGNRNSATICIILRQNDYSEHQDLLNNILKAIKLDVDKDVIFLLLEDDESGTLHKHITSKMAYVLSFGLGIRDIGINASFVANHFYQTESYAIMLTHALGKLNTDTQKKKALWTTLQKTFLDK